MGVLHLKEREWRAGDNGAAPEQLQLNDKRHRTQIKMTAPKQPANNQPPGSKQKEGEGKTVPAQQGGLGPS